MYTLEAYSNHPPTHPPTLQMAPRLVAGLKLPGLMGYLSKYVVHEDQGKQPPTHPPPLLPFRLDNSQ